MSPVISEWIIYKKAISSEVSRDKGEMRVSIITTGRTVKGLIIGGAFTRGI